MSRSERSPLVAALVMTVSLSLAAPAAAQPCSCSETLDSLAAAIENSYSGYPVKLDAWTRPELARLRSELRDEARSASDRQCRRILSRYVAWFGDGHLRVTHSPDGAVGRPILDGRDPGELRRLAGTSRGRAADGPRGVWRTPRGTLAVVPDSAGWVAVVIEVAPNGPPEGALVGRIGPRDGRGVYPLTFEREDHLQPHRASPIGDSLLLLAEEAWIRRGASGGGDPFAPSIRMLDGGTALLRLPSMLPQHHARLVELLRDQELLKRPDWIIDLRGNAGGSDGTYMPLLPFLFTDTIRTVAGSIRASDAARGHYARFVNPERPEDAPGWVRDLLAAMDTLHSGFVAGERWDLVYDSVTSVPRRVAMLIDGSNASSAETFLLKAIQSGKVRTFGRRTAGVVDFLNPAAIRICRGGGVLLWAPTSLRQRLLPLDAIDPHGLAPDVTIPTDVEDWVGWVRGRMDRLQ